MGLRRVFFSVSIALSFLSLSGQSRFEIGLIGGVNSSGIIISAANDLLDPGLPSEFEPDQSLHYGVYGLLRSNKFGVQTELLYSTQKNELIFSGSSFEWEKTYLDLPVTIKYFLPAGFNLHAGPQFSFLLDESSNAPGLNVDFDDFETNLAMGAGWYAPFGLQVNFRYFVSLSDVNDSERVRVKYDDLRNSVIQFSLGYRLFKFGQ